MASSAVKRWNGSSWQEFYAIKRWNDSEWQENMNFYRWDGDSWVGLIDRTPDTAQYSKEFSHTWMSSYNSSGNRRTDTSYGTQGLAPGSVNGQQTAMIGFDSSAIRSFIANGNVDKVTITYTVAHSWYNAGVVLVFGMHNVSSQPSTYSATNTNMARTDQQNTGTYTMTATNTFGNRFKANTSKGLTLDANSNDATYYGYISSCKIKFWVTK